MKKKICIALLLLTGQAFAGETFLSSFLSNSATISFSDLLEKISKHSVNTNVNLSVGESHLHSESALKINERIISEYFKSSSLKITTCLETLSHFDESAIGKYVYLESEKVKVFKGNSPYKTDFSNCFESKRSNYFTYSGFFHQYPFARPFPKEFPKTPVITDASNNILIQMKKSDSLFVTQMELEFLEFTATKSLILSLKESQDIDSFRANAVELVNKVEVLVQKMEQVVLTNSVFTSKNAVVLSQENFDINLNGEKNYFVITNFEYRTASKTLAFIKSLLKLDEGGLAKFAKKLDSSRLFMTTLFQVPDEEGNIATSSYGGPAYTFAGNTYIIHMISERESTLLTFSPEALEPHCLDYDSTQQVACF